MAQLCCKCQKKLVSGDEYVEQIERLTSNPANLGLHFMEGATANRCSTCKSVFCDECGTTDGGQTNRCPSCGADGDAVLSWSSKADWARKGKTDHSQRNRRRPEDASAVSCFLTCGTIVGIAILILVGLASIGAYLASRERGEVSAKTAEFFANVEDGRIDDAYKSASVRYKTQIDEHEFRKLAEQLGLEKGSTWHWKEVTMLGDSNVRAKVTGWIKKKDGKVQRIVVMMGKENDEWKVGDVAAGKSEPTAVQQIAQSQLAANRSDAEKGDARTVVGPPSNGEKVDTPNDQSSNSEAQPLPANGNDGNIDLADGPRTSSPEGHEIRTWTSTRGQRIQGEYLGYRNGNVGLLKDDGKEYWFAVDKLSLSDQKYVVQQITALSAVSQIDAENIETLRTWHNRKGQPAEAVFVKIVGENVRLLKADGQIVMIPVEVLSDVDQELLQERAKKRVGGSEQVK